MGKDWFQPITHKGIKKKQLCHVFKDVKFEDFAFIACQWNLCTALTTDTHMDTHSIWCSQSISSYSFFLLNILLFL